MNKRKFTTNVSEDDDDEDKTSVVFFLIKCHGMYYFTNDQPQYITIPSNIRYVNKITYTPFGNYNLLPNSIKLEKRVIDICDDKCQNYDLPSSDDLIQSLKEKVPLLEEQKKLFNMKQQNKNQYGIETECDFTKRCYYKMLFNKEDKIFQSVIYSSNNVENNIPIIQKTFKILPEDDPKFKFNIYVVYQKNGMLSIGDTILSSEVYKNFLSKKRTFSTFLNYQAYDTETITTQQLLEFAEYCNYNNVFIIDYSCSVCKDENGYAFSRDKVMDMDKLITLKQIGKGNNKRHKSKKIHILRKYKKTNKKRNNKKR